MSDKPFDLEAEVKRANAEYFDVPIPSSIRKKPRAEPWPREARRSLGRPIYQETRKRDEREMRRAYNRRDDDGE